MQNDAPSDDKEHTKSRLLEAAIDIFGRLGYEAASTRAIANAAGANLAAIPYYYGGEQGLYLAAADYLAQRIGGLMEPVVAHIHTQLHDHSPDRKTTLQLLHSFTDAFAGNLTLPESAAWARFILREQMSPTDAFKVLYAGVMDRLISTLTALIARLTGLDPHSEYLRASVLTVVGQLIVFRAARATVLQYMQWTEVGPAQLELIRAVIRDNISAIVRGARKNRERQGPRQRKEEQP